MDGAKSLSKFQVLVRIKLGKVVCVVNKPFQVSGSCED